MSSSARTVTLTHPDSGQRIEVDTRVLDRYQREGWRVAEVDAPKGKASLADWQTFARSRGFTDADLEGKTRAELRAALA